MNFLSLFLFERPDTEPAVRPQKLKRAYYWWIAGVQLSSKEMSAGDFLAVEGCNIAINYASREDLAVELQDKCRSEDQKTKRTMTLSHCKRP